MTGARLSLAVSSASASTLVELGLEAEGVGLDGLWVAPGRRHASEVLATLGAVAARTRHLRLGAFLTIGADRYELLRAAEDMGVLDQASGGRLEVALVRPPGVDRHTLGEAWTILFGAWTGWRTSTGAHVAVTPRPAQPWLPRLVLDDPDLAAHLGGGLAIQATEPPAIELQRRVLLRGVNVWPVPTAATVAAADDAVSRLREEVARFGTDELVLVASPDEIAGGRVRHLASTLAPALRAAPDDQRYLLEGAIPWYGALSRRS